jgi:uncharacterized Zn finger protein
VSVAERRRRAAKKIAKMNAAGRGVSPVAVAGRRIAATFWGDAWCKNLEAYSDFANRLPRGRTYVRSGAVIDLRIEAGLVRGLVSGTDVYSVGIKIRPLAKQRWTDVKSRCAGRIDSLVELLQGSLSKGVMEIVTRKGEGLFPSPREISLGCSCPDWAAMCKHVAATLYGVGVRLDDQPELLFTLRGVDPAEMVEAAVDRSPRGAKPRSGRSLRSDELSSVFGVDIDLDGSEGRSDRGGRPAARTRTRKGTASGAKKVVTLRTGNPRKAAKTTRRGRTAATTVRTKAKGADGRRKTSGKTAPKRATKRPATRASSKMKSAGKRRSR